MRGLLAINPSESQTRPPSAKHCAEVDAKQSSHHDTPFCNCTRPQSQQDLAAEAIKGLAYIAYLDPADPSPALAQPVTPSLLRCKMKDAH